MTLSSFFKQSASSRDSSLQVSRTWLPPGFSTSYQIKKELQTSHESQSKLSEFTSEFWPLILQPLLAVASLLDQKGGAKDDTLLRLEGQLLLEEEPVPFSYHITTKFLDYPSKNQIRFSWGHTCSIEELEALSVLDICQKQDVLITSFVFSLECFQSNMLTRLSGFGPVVAETLQLEISRSSLNVRVTTEATNSPKSLPFKAEEVFEKISSLLERYYQFKLQSDYTTLQGELK